MKAKIYSILKWTFISGLILLGLLILSVPFISTEVYLYILVVSLVLILSYPLFMMLVEG